MNQIRYTIVIEDGKLSGISQHTGNLDAVPLSLAELVSIVPSINADALTAKEELEAAHAEQLSNLESRISDANSVIAEKDAYIARVAAAKDAIIAAVLDPETDTESAIKTVIYEAEKPEEERARDAIRAQIAELQAKLES